MVRSTRHSVACLSSIVAGLFFVHSSHAVAPVEMGTVQLPPPDANAFLTSFNYDSTGSLYAWDGLSVSKEITTGPSAGSFTVIGQAPAGNNADAGPIAFSQDGTQVLVGNGSGGNAGGTYSGEIFQLPKSGGDPTGPVGNVPYQFDFLAVPASTTITGSASKFFVDQGNSTYDGSSVSVFDATNGTDPTVIANIPGASASIAINIAQNRLYAEIGFGSGQGEIRSFDLSAVSQAYNTGTSIDFESGTLFSNVATPQSGAGLFFDKDGYLFAGGDGGITVYNPNGSVSYEQEPDGDSIYAAIAYNSVADQVIEGPNLDNYPSANTATLYSASSFESAAPEPVGAGLFLAAGALVLSRRGRAHRFA